MIVREAVFTCCFEWIEECRALFWTPDGDWTKTRGLDGRKALIAGNEGFGEALVRELRLYATRVLVYVGEFLG